MHDEAGQLLDDDAAAREAALIGASELIAEHVAAGALVDLRHRLEVEGKDRGVIAVIRFGDLFTGYAALKPDGHTDDFTRTNV